MSDFDSPIDTELISAFRTGDSDAFAGIFDRYANVVFSALLAAGEERPDALESTHDTFIEAASRLEGLETPDDLQTWLLEISAGVAGSGEIAPSPDDLVPVPPALRVRVLGKVDRSVDVPVKAPIGTPEWMNVGIFAVVTLFVGLVGLLVSAGFDSAGPPASTPVTASPTVAGAATTTTTAVPSSTTTRSETSTTRAETSTTSGTASAGPASIEISTDSVDLGDDGTEGAFDLRNTGGDTATWELTPTSEAIAVSSSQGELAGGEAVTVELTLDREQIEEGDLSETVMMNWSGGQAEVAIVGIHEDNPIIHNPQASPSAVEVSGGDSDCDNTQTTVSARIRDTSSVESVVVRWSPDGSNEEETEMASIGDDMFQGVVGPFTVAQTTDVRIVAFDDRGNAGGASAPVSVVSCP